MRDRADVEARDPSDDEVTAPAAGELEEALEATFIEEGEEAEEGEESDEAAEQEAGEEEAAVEAEVEAVPQGEEDRALREEAVLEVILRRTGVLPETNAIEREEEAELPEPRREDEFVCTSCFLVKPRTQLRDPQRRICGDCLDPPGDPGPEP